MTSYTNVVVPNSGPPYTTSGPNAGFTTANGDIVVNSVANPAINVIGDATVTLTSKTTVDTTHTTGNQTGVSDQGGANLTLNVQSGSTVTGSQDAVNVQGGGTPQLTLTNQGTLSGDGSGIFTTASGTILNTSTGLITGGRGPAVNLAGSGMVVTNGGLLQGNSGAAIVNAVGANTLVLTYLGQQGMINGSIQLNSGTLSLSTGTVASVNLNTTISNGGGGALAKVGTGTLQLTGTNTYTGGTTFAAGELQAGSSSAFGSSGTLSFNGGTLGYANSTTTDFSARFSGAANQAYSVDTNGLNVTYATGLTSSGGTLTKLGAGTLILGANSTFTGGTTISAGQITESSVGAALGTGGVTIASGATLAFRDSTSNVVSVAPTTFSGAGTITVNTSYDATTNPQSLVAFGNSGNVNVALSQGGLIDVQTGRLNGSASFQGIWTNNFGSLQIDSGAIFDGAEAAIRIDALTGSGTLTGGGGGTRTTTIGVAGGSGSFSGVIADDGLGAALQLIKVGAGNQTLNGVDTYSGGTTISAGQLTVTKPGGLGTDAVVNNAALSLSTGAGGTFANAVSGTGTFVVQNAGAALTLSGAITGSQSFYLASGSSNITTLSGINSFSGGTTIQAGTLSVMGGAALSDTGAVTIYNVTGATLQVNTSETIGSLASGPGGGTGAVTIASGQTLTTGGANTSTTYSGTVSGAGALAVAGLTGGGAATFNGAVTNTGGVNLGMAGNIVVGATGSIMNDTFNGSVQVSGTGDTVSVAQGGTVDYTGNANRQGAAVHLVAAGTLTNLGLVESTGPSGQGVIIDAGGTINNGSTARITATAGSGVLLTSDAATTVNNYGRIDSNNGGLVQVNGTGPLTVNNLGANADIDAAGDAIDSNALTLTNTGNIVGGTNGIENFAGVATITNAGTIAAGTYNIFTKTTTIGGQFAVEIVSGSVTNSGTIQSGGASIYQTSTSGTLNLVNTGTIGGSARTTDPDDTVVAEGAATIFNGGTISTPNYFAVSMLKGGTLTNAAGGQITAGTAGNRYGVDVANGSGVINNYGSITSTSATSQGVTTDNNAATISLFAGSTTGAISTGSAADTVTLYNGAGTSNMGLLYNTVTGATSVGSTPGANQVVLQNAGTLAAASFSTIALGGGANTLTLRGAGDGTAANGAAATLALGAVTAAGGSYTLNKVDTGRWTLTGTTAAASSATVMAGELDLGLNALGTAAVATTAGSLTVFSSTTTQTQTGTVTGAGALAYNLTGGGAVTVGNALGGFSGPLTVTGGDLSFAGTTQLGTGTSKTLNNATLHYTGMFNNSLENGSPATLVLNGTADGIDVGSVGLNTLSTISGAAQLVKTGAGVLQIYSANNAYAGGTAVNAGTLELESSGAAGAGQIALAAGVTLNAFATTANAVAVNGAATLHVNTSGATTLSGALSGAGALNATGAGLYLGNAAGYTGAFTDNLTGTLELSAGNALGSSFTFGSATKLQLDGQAAGGQFTSTLSGLAGGDQLDARGVGTASAAVLVGADVQLRSSAGAVLYTFHLASAASVAGDYFTTAADGNGGSTLFVNVNANAPVITSGANATEVQFTPASTVVYTTTASDADAGNVLTYSIAGGADAADFNINAANGQVTFKASPSFNAPIDADHNDLYQVTVAANDGLHTTTKDVTVSVTNSVTNAPTVTGVTQPAPVTEAGDASAQDIPATPASIQVRDADTTGQLTATTTSGAVAMLNGAAVPAGTFVPAALTQASALSFPNGAAANGGAVSIAGAYDPAAANLDFLAAGDVLTLSFPVTVSDSAGHTAATTVTVTIDGTNDAPVLGNAASSAGLVPFGSTLVLEPSITVSDLDRNAMGSGAQVAITSGFSVGDQLTVGAPQAGITAAYNAATGVLTLTGAASDAAYQAELRSVTYGRSAIDSGAGTRGFSFTVTDDQGASSAPVVETLTAAYGSLAGGGGGGSVPTNLDVQQAFPTQTSNLTRTSANDPALQTPTSPLYAQAQAEKGIAAALDSGQLSLADAQNALYHLVDGSTSVAEISYAFFTGKTPTQAGLNYLVHSAQNTTDLNDPYYAQFTTENRYINFANNLATGPGAGAAAFQANYGSLSLTDATAKAYAAIFGTTPTADKITAILTAQVSNGLGGTETRAQYFSDITGGSAASQKAAAIGFLLADSVKEGFGTYQQADLHFLADLAHGTAVFNVDLLAAYGTAPSLVGAPVTDTTLGS